MTKMLYIKQNICAKTEQYLIQKRRWTTNNSGQFTEVFSGMAVHGVI